MLFERQSDAYRRGLTLGLTMAEIFILVVFMLLLMLLALYADNAGKEKKYKKTIAECESGPMPPDMGPIGQLNECEKEKAALRNRVVELEKANAALRDRVAELEKANAVLRNRVAELEKANVVLRNRVVELEKANVVLRNRVVELEKANVVLRNRVVELEKANAVLRNQVADLKKQIKKHIKGINPPCWYKVKYPAPAEKRHEKAYYLMDIAVHDDYLQVALRPPPPGRAIDESEERAPTTYREEYARLPLASFRAAGDMSLTAFAKNAEPIRHMGKNEQIRRDYPCVFYAAVWDMTGPAQKERWKRARATIEIYFPTYEVRDDPWPGDAGN